MRSEENLPTLVFFTNVSHKANELYEKVKTNNVHLLTPESTSFSRGVIITTVHLAKGLEFDEVIVPFVSSVNYKSDTDRRMLYIACTRAMHKLTITFEKERSEFLRG